MTPDPEPPLERHWHSHRGAGAAEPPSVRIAPVFLRLGFITAQERRSVPAHRHREHEIIVAHEGGYSCAVNGSWMDLAPGDGVAIQPGDWHEDRFRGATRYFGLCFDLAGEDLRPRLPGIFRLDVQPEEQRFRVPRAVYEPLFEGIRGEGERGDAVAGHIQDALLLAFFWQMIRALPTGAVNPAFLALSGDQAFPGQLRRFFRAHVHEDLSVAEMAEHLHMSESSLSHKCTRLLGASPHKAFLRVRMERAQYLLANTEMSVKEVAAELGFEDPYGFSRTFKTVCGVAPTHWRDRRAGEG